MTLTGTIRINKRLRRHPIWQRPDYGWAWIDLLLLANDEPRAATVNGEVLQLKRGQLAWSLRTLEKEWGKSGEWINHFLDFCRDEGMVKVDSNRRRTIITITNYSVYNPLTVTEPDTDAETETVTEPGTITEQKVEAGIGKGKGEAPPAENSLPEIPDDSTLRAFFEAWPGDLSRGIPAGVPEVWWSGWVANRLLDEKKWPRDWQRVAVLAFRADFLNRHPKALGGLSNGRAVTSAATGNESVAAKRYRLDKELQALRGRLDAAYETSTGADPDDERREREIEEELKAL